VERRCIGMYVMRVIGTRSVVWVLDGGLLMVCGGVLFFYCCGCMGGICAVFVVCGVGG